MTHGSDPEPIDRAGARPTFDSPARRVGPRDVLVTIGLLAPVLAAVWAVPWFVTQDGLAHLYNASIIADSFTSDSPFQPYYEVHWKPLPNWAGHLALVGLLGIVSPWTADRIMMSVTLVGFAVSAVWLRGKVVGGQSSFASCVLSALSALSFSWLMGFASFQLGACLFPITLGVWWQGRDALKPGRMAALSALLVLGYFCHLVSLGLTVCALMFLALFLPWSDMRSWRSRLLRTGLCLIPLSFLGVVYLRLSRQGGPMHPKFPSPAEFLSVAGWVRRLGWVDPISLAMKDVLPFTDHVGPVFAIFCPAVWLAGAGLLSLGVVLRRPRDSSLAARERRVWLALAAVLVLGGVFGPDAMGSGHGEYLPQRVALLGLVALVPAIDLGRKTGMERLATAALSVALVLQTVIVWDYAIDSQGTAGQIAEAASSSVDRGRRVATLLTNVETRFRVNPLLHADCWLGVANGAVLWSNYETRYYYFPVQFREEIVRPDSFELEQIALMSAPANAEERQRRWERLLVAHQDAIDEVLVWREEPGLDAITERFFSLIERRGDVRIYGRREGR